MKAKINAMSLERLKIRAAAKQKPTLMWDTDLRGFGARSSVTGEISWIVQRWAGGVGGKAKRVTLGRAPAIDLDKARELAAIAIGQHYQGVDVVGVKEQRRKEVRERLNSIETKAAWDLYFKRHQKPGRYWADVSSRFEKHVLPELPKRLCEIDKHDIRRLLDAKEAEGKLGAARTLYVFLNPFFAWAVSRDYITANPMATLPRPEPAAKRDRVLNDHEFRAFWQACGELGVFGQAYRFLALTGQRRDEVCTLEWTELDLEKREWIIPSHKSKNGVQHVIQLSDQALAILEEQRKPSNRYPRSGPYVFSTYRFKNQAGPLRGHGKAKKALDAAMSKDLPLLKPWRIHDLRRGFATGLAALDFLPNVIERCLNHLSGANGGLVQIYQRFEYLEQRRQAFIAWGNRVDELVNGKPVASNILKLRA